MAYLSRVFNKVRLRRSNQIKADVFLGEKLFIFSVYAFLIGFALICLIPFWLVVAGSFTPEITLRQEGFQLFPQKISTYAYEYVINGKQIGRSYVVSSFVTGVGTLLALGVSVPFAYVLSRRIWIARPLSFLSYFTMVVGGGLVGFYILISNWLGLKDSKWSLILPYLLNPFFVFVLLAYFRTLPEELLEAAKMDGANDLIIFWRIVCPISIPIIATVGLFYALQYWNDWWLALLFIDNPDNHPLQFMLKQLQATTDARFYIGNAGLSYQLVVPNYGVRMATVCLTIGPVLLIYPFIQQYFIKGITLGALKG
jgi:multiple sugar transport system permease protein/putative aldouronate transport system permease protein